MRKGLLQLAYMGAIALMSSVAFSACSDDKEDSGIDNPNYSEVAKEVHTQFVLNVEMGGAANTRMDANAVQKNSNFRGMRDAKIITMETSNKYLSSSEVGGSTNKLTKVLDFPTLYTSDAIDPTDNANSSKRVLDVSLPVKTNSILIYGRANKLATDSKASVGSVTFDFGSSNPYNASDIKISLESRIGSNQAVFEKTLDLAALVLNRLFLAHVDSQTDTSWTRTISDYKTTALNLTFDANPTSLKWKDLGDDYDAHTSQSSLEEILGQAYSNLTTIKSGEIRAGSAYAIGRMVFDLYNICKNAWNATATSDEERNVQRLVFDIHQRIDAYFTIGTETATFRPIGNASDDGQLANQLVSIAGAALATDFTGTTGKYYGVNDEMLTKFPRNFGIPGGTAQLVWDSDLLTTGYPKGFRYAKPSDSPEDYSSLLGNYNFDYKNYMYPAEITYFVNSPIRTTNVEKQLADYPNGTRPDTGWGKATWDGWVTSGVVDGSTKAVAVQKSINYGTALLETQVKYDADSFVDNRDVILGAGSGNQSLTPAELGLTLTGVLIGGQPNQVDWEYLPVSNAPADYKYVVFDTAVGAKDADGNYLGITIPTDKSSSPSNYTSVFDNYIEENTTSVTAQNKIRVALEFKNGNREFWGEKNMVRKGGYFYLVAELDPAATSGITAISGWPGTDAAAYQIPPLTSSGLSTKKTRVFIQDFLTKAVFKIGATSLQKAYLTVPDLQSAQMSLGLSVDISWQTGLAFEVELGGR